MCGSSLLELPLPIVLQVGEEVGEELGGGAVTGMETQPVHLGLLDQTKEPPWPEICGVRTTRVTQQKGQNRKERVERVLSKGKKN